MQYDALVNEVRARAELEDRTGAERAITTTLDVLGERLAGGEPSDLAAQLPPEIKGLLEQHTGEGERFGVDEFLRRVAERHGEGCTLEEVEHKAVTVLAVISESVSHGEFDDLRQQLPTEYHSLLG